MMEQFQCLLVGSVAVEPSVRSPALSFAGALAERTAARITACVISSMNPVFWLRGDCQAIHALKPEIERAVEITRLQAHEIQKMLGSRVTVSPSLPDVLGLERPTGRLVRLARVHDLSILDATSANQAAQRAAIEDVLFESGHPLIVVPETGGIPFPERIAIAWDGSSSARAIRDALPFLRAARLVSIVTVAGEKDLSAMTPGEDLANHLLLKGVPDVRVEMLSAPDRNVSARLRRFVADSGCGMLVLGAAAHARFRQTVLGGVTRDLLDCPPATLLMAH